MRFFRIFQLFAHERNWESQLQIFLPTNRNTFNNQNCETMLRILPFHVGYFNYSRAKKKKCRERSAQHGKKRGELRFSNYAILLFLMVKISSLSSAGGFSHTYLMVEVTRAKRYELFFLFCWLRKYVWFHVSLTHKQVSSLMNNKMPLYHAISFCACSCGIFVLLLKKAEVSTVCLPNCLEIIDDDYDQKFPFCCVIYSVLIFIFRVWFDRVFCTLNFNSKRYELNVTKFKLF